MLYLGDTKVSPTTIIKTSEAKAKCGLTIDNFIGDIDSNGNLTAFTGNIIFDGRGIKNVGDYGLYYKFYQNRNISSIDLSDLEEITGYCALDNLANGASNLNEVNLRNLKKISGDYACRNICNISGMTGKLINSPFDKLQTINGSQTAYGSISYQNNLINTGLSNLVSISGYYVCGYMYQNCMSITDIELDNLTTISGSNACQNMFGRCTSLTRADFPSLVSIDNINAFGTASSNCIFANCTNLTEIHFRADAQTLIESLTGYQYLFGATNATIYFDL